jgi:hypothetical protein
LAYEENLKVGELFANGDARWKYLVELDDEMLKGGVMVSEFAAEWIRNCDLCFANAAYLACVITAFQAIETMLRTGDRSERKSVDLINSAAISDGNKQRLHALRKFRNSWVHVNDPFDDEAVLQDLDQGNPRLFEQAFSAVRLMREVLYLAQFV